MSYVNQRLLVTTDGQTYHNNVLWAMESTAPPLERLANESYSTMYDVFRTTVPSGERGGAGAGSHCGGSTRGCAEVGREEEAGPSVVSDEDGGRGAVVHGRATLHRDGAAWHSGCRRYEPGRASAHARRMPRPAGEEEVGSPTRQRLNAHATDAEGEEVHGVAEGHGVLAEGDEDEAERKGGSAHRMALRSTTARHRQGEQALSAAVFAEDGGAHGVLDVPEHAPTLRVIVIRGLCVGVEGGRRHRSQPKRGAAESADRGMDPASSASQSRRKSARFHGTESRYATLQGGRRLRHSEPESVNSVLSPAQLKNKSLPFDCGSCHRRVWSARWEHGPRGT